MHAVWHLCELYHQIERIDWKHTVRKQNLFWTCASVKPLQIRRVYETALRASVMRGDESTCGVLRQLLMEVDAGLR